jgi:hypothetical protein
VAEDLDSPPVESDTIENRNVPESQSTPLLFGGIIKSKHASLSESVDSSFEDQEGPYTMSAMTKLALAQQKVIIDDVNEQNDDQSESDSDGDGEYLSEEGSDGEEDEEDDDQENDGNIEESGEVYSDEEYSDGDSAN